MRPFSAFLAKKGHMGLDISVIFRCVEKTKVMMLVLTCCDRRNFDRKCMKDGNGMLPT